MVFDTVCSRFTLAWNDSSSCTTSREKTVKGWCYEDEYCTKEHISTTKSNYWCTYVSTQTSVILLKYLLNDAHPLGDITDYVIKIEFQMRGSPHAHCLLWVKDAPKINQDSDDDACRFIDKYITAMIPKGVLKGKMM